jgi:hypothetical protein
MINLPGQANMALRWFGYRQGKVSMWTHAFQMPAKGNLELKGTTSIKLE